MRNTKSGVKIMDNNLKHKTGMAAPHSKLKASGQEINPYPEVIKKKIKKKKSKVSIPSETALILSHKSEIRGLV